MIQWHCFFRARWHYQRSRPWELIPQGQRRSLPSQQICGRTQIARKATRTGPRDSARQGGGSSTQGRWDGWSTGLRLAHRPAQRR
jgi:hypothetical protein